MKIPVNEAFCLNVNLSAVNKRFSGFTDCIRVIFTKVLACDAKLISVLLLKLPGKLFKPIIKVCRQYASLVLQYLFSSID